MEEILKEVIEIDKCAKSIVKEEKDKKNNIETFIEEEYRTKKSVLDLEYKAEINKQKQKYEKYLEEKKKEIQKKSDEEIGKFEFKYKKEFERVVHSIVDSIKKEVE